MKLSWKRHTLAFTRPAGTSRGYLRTKDSYFLYLEDSGLSGVGECGLLRGLSADDRPDYEQALDWLSENLHLEAEELHQQLREFPSIQAGLEMALLDLQAVNHELFPSDFTRGMALQPINGLIWMGDKNYMLEQISTKIDQGFEVLKMKIGALEWEQEHSILEQIRKKFSFRDLEIRVDANGAFSPTSAPKLLDQLAALKVHSIEQPIRAGQWEAMAALCADAPVPIALDEELIGVFENEKKVELLDSIKPHYIILKPSFLGGFANSEFWISEAQKRSIGWWATSALESNLGLSAIAQWNYLQNNPRPSGLGTGSLYSNNITSPLYIKGGGVGYDPEGKWGI